MNRFLSGSLLTLAISMGVSAAAAAPATQLMSIVKECSTYTGDIPSLCTVVTSNVAAIPKGTKIWYFGPDLGVADPVMTSSKVTIDGDGGLADGYCIVDQRDPAAQAGMCAFTAGSGSLADFHAILKVTVNADGTFNWDGSYWTK